MVRRPLVLSVLAENPEAEQAIDSVSVAHAFARDLRNDSAEEWCVEVQRSIAESRRECPPVRNTASARTDEAQKRADALRKEIRRLELELASVERS